MKTRVWLSAVAILASVGNPAFSETIDLTPDALSSGQNVILSGTIKDIDAFAVYPIEHFFNDGQFGEYYTYKLQTGVLTDGLLFYSKTERDTGDEVNINGRLVRYAPGKGTKGHGMLKLYED
ncbi:hypothetical protein [Parendozoicomonas haliclonae]|uniref:Uncharacterized protein n=1 Tax=Parendozoicomonas haliclonae TaxID=1960125 RepID=A0A1X7APZ3_9GAMM|nr:hypothetical protein [Parendozoicomonas haliclonae]SMA50213.1 hypothetical protein EHSB41UT_04006 [Parendozoicomonas haliclonae]